VLFEEWLATRSVQQQQEIAKEGKGQSEILKKIHSYNPLYKTRGNEIGAALAEGLLDMRGHVRDAALELANEIAKAIGIGANAAHAASVNATNDLGGKTDELMRVVRRELAEVGRNNPNIFAGRA